MLPDINTYLQLAQRIFALLGTVLYLIFALVVVKQTTTMANNIHDKFNTILIAFSYLHLIFSALLIFLTLTVG